MDDLAARVREAAEELAEELESTDRRYAARRDWLDRCRTFAMRELTPLSVTLRKMLGEALNVGTILLVTFRIGDDTCRVDAGMPGGEEVNLGAFPTSLYVNDHVDVEAMVRVVLKDLVEAWRPIRKQVRVIVSSTFDVLCFQRAPLVDDDL